MTMMIALVGEQVLPNFLPVQHYHPSDILLVYTTTKQQVHERLKATLQKEVKVHELKTDPYDILTIAESLDKELTKLVGPASSELVFNLTGGTKTMSLAAYQVAQQRMAPMIYVQSEGKHTRMYHYTWKTQQLQPIASELLPEYLTLHDVFDLHFGPGNWQEQGAARSEGGPFEDALAATLRAHEYEVMVGVKAMGQIDIDVAIRASNQYGIIEAKMGKNGKNLDGVKQLNNAVRHLGTYSQTLYVITVLPEGSHKILTDASNIEVISLPGYDVVTNTLSLADEAELLKSVEKVLKG